jgi:hypothetical protein
VHGCCHLIRASVCDRRVWEGEVWVRRNVAAFLSRLSNIQHWCGCDTSSEEEEAFHPASGGCFLRMQTLWGTIACASKSNNRLTTLRFTTDTLSFVVGAGAVLEAAPTTEPEAPASTVVAATAVTAVPVADKGAEGAGNAAAVPFERKGSEALFDSFKGTPLSPPPPPHISFTRAGLHAVATR